MKIRVLLFMLLAVASSAIAQESIRAYGLFSIDDKLIVFGSTHGCADNSADGSAQMFVSTDGGKTLRKMGPAIERSELERFLIGNGKLWVGGVHTADGPTIDPFLLVPIGNGWEQRIIYSGNLQLYDAAITPDGELRASVQPVDPAGSRGGAEINLYSSDAGKTWKRLRGKPAKNASSNFMSFREIEKTFNDWQINDLEHGGFQIQHMVNGNWETVSEFPMKPCAE